MNSWRLSLSDIPDVFADITPVDVKQDVGGVATIDYSTAFTIAYGYMRAILRTNEMTERTLKLSATCLQLNPANYTVWHFRRLCLSAVHHSTAVDGSTTGGEDLSYVAADLDLAASLGGDNPKNYQIWYHRRALLEKKMDDPVAELAYIGSVLHHDAKNYHAWSHRQWVVGTAAAAANATNVWESELEFTNTLITADSRNNSAWNHRWFVVHKGLLSLTSNNNNNNAPQHALSPESAASEMEYALRSAKLDADNESSWRYFIAILKEQIFSLQDAATVMTLLSQSMTKLDEVRNSLGGSDGAFVSPNLSSAAIDILEWKADRASLKQAVALAESLANEHDTIRQKYWNFRVQEMKDAIVKL